MIERITSTNDPRLDDYLRMTDVRLRSRIEPERGLFMAESYEVISRALDAGMRPRSFLMSEKWLPRFAPLFERFPELKFAVIEGGFAWVPPLAWRLDKVWERNRSEAPQVKRPPSEYMRSNVWYATQPVEEPENPSELGAIIDWIGADRLLFATDYPHWDMDDPRYAFKTPLDKEVQRRIFSQNARELYNLG